jgi:hypothetical protein
MAYEIVAGRTVRQREAVGLKGTVYLGKNYVMFDSNVSLANPVYLDVASPHVVLISGKRGTGKSYSIGVITEGISDLPSDVSNNIAALVFDTMGIFWTMKYPNYRDDALLRTWNIQPKAYSPVIFAPFGLFEEYQKNGIPVDVPFAIKPSEISAENWATIFNLDLISDEGTLLERSVEVAREKFGDDMDINNILEIIKADKKSSDRERYVLENRFSVAKKWGLFSSAGTKISQLFKGGTTTILDLSGYHQVEGGERVKALVIGLVSRKIFEQRVAARKAEEVKLISEGGFLLGAEAALIEEKAPLVWIFIDEAHEFIPREPEETLATEPLMQILREGRQPGISLVLATQQPGKIHTDVMTQADIVISHRVTAKIDVESLNLIASTYLPQAIQRYVDELPAEKGSAVMIDDKLEKIYAIQVRPKTSWHGGEDPTAIRSELRAYGLAA